MTNLVQGSPPTTVTSHGEYRMSMDESVSARAAAPQPAEVRRSRVFGDSRGERWASGLLGALMGSEAVLGMFISFTTVNEQMAPAFGNRAPLIPLGIDIGILVFGLADVLLTFWRIPKAMVRWFEWLLVTATIYLNASGAEAGWVRAAHITLPLLWVVSCEVVRHVVRDRLDVLTGTPTDPIPVLVWLMYPLYAFRTKRRMVRWQVKSYQQALLLDAALHSREARLEAEYGRKWRREAPPEERLAYRLRERIPASLLAQALVADAELDRAIAQAQGQAAPAALAAEAGATAMATAQIEALLSDTRELAANIVAGLAASRTLPGLADPGPAQGSADHADRRTLGSGPTAQTTVQPPAAGLRTLGADPSQGEGSADPDPRNHDQRTLGADPRTPGSEITGLADPGSAGLPDPRTLGLAHHGADRPQAQNEYAQAFPQPYQQLVITGEGPADSATAQESAGGTRTGYDQWPPAADPRNAAAADPRLPVFAAPTDPSLGEGSADPDPRNHDQRTLGADPRTLGSATAGPSGLEVRTAGPQGPQNPGARVPDPRRSLESGSGAPAADPRPPVEPLPQEAAADPTCGGLWSAETGDLARAVVAKLPTDTRTRATFLAAFRAAGGAIGNDRRGKLYAYAIAPDLPAPEESDEQDLVETANGHRH